MSDARYLIGVDLGTTNSCVYYTDTQDPRLAVQLLRIPQCTTSGYIEQLETIPSFCYLAAEQEWPKGALDLPWKQGRQFIVGSLAKEHGAKVPTRLVESAKSWLCHAAAKRKDPILPSNTADENIRISPVEATGRYLQHIREAWDHLMAKQDPEAVFDQQEVVVTVPASFDEVARTLTVEAATKAGFRSLTLLEEPQAAFYSWIAKNETVWQNKMKADETILICDVGGGTTDFSLIVVTETETGLGFQRMAVGNHLLLGGDNIDAAVSHLINTKMRAVGHPELSPEQWVQLKHQARKAKETLLGGETETYSALLQGSGSSVVKGSLSVEIHREELLEYLLKGFFGIYTWEEALELKRTRGIRTMGLPYEDEPSITKHLAYFLNQSGLDAPDYVLFNGGTMKPEPFRNAVVDSLVDWFPDKAPQVLETVSLDLAVARGATYYGKVKRGLGTRIGGGSARGYYLAVDVKRGEQTTKQALTLLPRGSEEGSVYEPDQVFSLTPNTPVSFEMLSSHTRLEDKQGDFVSIQEEELQSLPSIQTILRYGKQQKDPIPVQLHIGLTSIGTLELWLKSINTDHTWSLQFELRGEAASRQEETFDTVYLQKAEETIENLFNGSGLFTPKEVIEKLEEALDRPKSEWTPSILRGLWKPLIKMAPKRKCSSKHEARWWNLAGYFLRPGFGYPMDDFRIKELWKIILSDQQQASHPDVALQFWICCRRVAGGLNKGQQIQLASKILPTIWNKSSYTITIKNKQDLYPYHEKIRTLAAMELLQSDVKVKLGKALLKRIQNGESKNAEFWALARLGSRQLAYGSIANVIPVDECNSWIKTLMATSGPSKSKIFALEHLARKTEHPELNIPQQTVDHILSKYEDTQRLQEMLTRVQKLTVKEQEQVLGDQLPTGLTIEK